MVMSPKAMAPTKVVSPTVQAAELAAKGHVLPGSLPGGGHEAAPVPCSPEVPKRGRQDDHDPGKHLFAFVAIHTRQDTTDDEVAKMRTEIIQIKAVLDKVAKEGVGSDTVEQQAGGPAATIPKDPSMPLSKSLMCILPPLPLHRPVLLP